MVYTTFYMDTTFCIDQFCSENSRHNISNGGRHICCHYYDGYKYENFDKPNTIHKIDNKILCCSILVSDANINERDIERKYCCKHRNIEQKFEIACLFFNYYVDIEEELTKLILNPDKICYDDFLPGEMIRQNKECKNRVCCKHYFMDRNNNPLFPNKHMNPMLMGPSRYMSYNNQWFCIAYLCDGYVPVSNSYTEQCCAHRTQSELQNILTKIQKYYEERRNKKLKILSTYFFEYMLTYIPKVLIEIILEYC